MKTRLRLQVFCPAPVLIFCVFSMLTLITGCATYLPEKITVKQVIENNLEPTYITIAEGLNFRDTHNATEEPQLFEAEINSHLAWFNYFAGQSTPVVLPSFMLKINPKVQVRMFREASFPVRTPGYLPRGTAFFWWGREQEINQDFNYFTLMFSHHSNGQAGEFLNRDGTINT